MHDTGKCVVDPRFDVPFFQIVVATPSHAFKRATGSCAAGVLRHIAAIHRPCELACTRGLMRLAVGIRPKSEGVVPLADFRAEYFVMIVRCRVCYRLIWDRLLFGRHWRRLLCRLRVLRHYLEGEGDCCEDKHRPCENAASHIIASFTDSA